MHTEAKQIAWKLYNLGCNVTAIGAGTKAPMYQWKHGDVSDVDARQTIARLKAIPWTGKTSPFTGVQYIAPAARAGIIHSDSVGQWRCIDLDAYQHVSEPYDTFEEPTITKQPVSLHLVMALLYVLDLPNDYHWCLRSGSGKGYHIYVRSEGDLAETDLGGKGVVTFVPLQKYAHDVDHIELRWHSCQTVPAFRNQDDVPNEPPELIGMHHLISALAIFGTPRTERSRPRTIPRIPRDDSTIDEIRSRLDLVRVADAVIGGRTETSGYEVRYLGHGGLLVNTQKQSWFCHQTECGGGLFDLLCYARHGTVVNDDKELFKEALKEAADMAGVELRPQRTPVHDKKGYACCETCKFPLEQSKFNYSTAYCTICKASYHNVAPDTIKYKRRVV